jgi:hypothetical protein
MNNSGEANRKWKKLYAIVIINLVVLIILFYLFTAAFE